MADETKRTWLDRLRGRRQARRTRSRERQRHREEYERQLVRDGKDTFNTPNRPGG